jgi:hypothetical protein
MSCVFADGNQKYLHSLANKMDNFIRWLLFFANKIFKVVFRNKIRLYYWIKQKRSWVNIILLNDCGYYNVQVIKMFSWIG